MAIITTDDGRSMTLPLEDHTMGELREIVREELFSDHQDTPLSLWKCTLWYESENERRVCYDSWSAQMIPTIHATIEETTVDDADYLYFVNDVIQDGEECFDYLVHSMDRMIDGNTLPHFMIHSMYRLYSKEASDIKITYGLEIEALLIPWIHAECSSGRLLRRDHWRSFHDADMPGYPHLGYRSLFHFQNFYLQLGIQRYDLYYIRNEECKYCIEGGRPYHFTLRLYGIEQNGVIIPYDTPIMPDMYIPQRHWDNNYEHTW